jgi:2-oxo-4-hydroxy-4-carboxy-5-ureidoimidazoline decarboxylase
VTNFERRRIVSEVLARWNRLPGAGAEKEIAACCGSKAWARELSRRRPFGNDASLLAAADEVWRALSADDWMEAFRGHPRIGESRAARPVEARSAAWSAQEQSGVGGEEADATKASLDEANREYEQRFGHIFIVCATGKSGAEILEILRRRLHNDAAAELNEAVEQQRQITQIRLKRWMTE